MFEWSRNGDLKNTYHTVVGCCQIFFMLRITPVNWAGHSPTPSTHTHTHTHTLSLSLSLSLFRKTRKEAKRFDRLFLFPYPCHSSIMSGSVRRRNFPGSPVVRGRPFTAVGPSWIAGGKLRSCSQAIKPKEKENVRRTVMGEFVP